MNLLEEIFTHKRMEVKQRKQTLPLDRLRPLAEAAAAPLDFIAALHKASPRAIRRPPALIAEVKQASPSRGLLAVEFDPLRLANIYAENGASAISVLADEKYFKGSLDYLRQIAAARSQRQINEPRLPLLCKDFIYDPYQVYEARLAGADAILLIAAALQPDQLKKLHTLALQLGMTPLVEVHNRDELNRALDCQPLLLGVNNRNLHDFTVDLNTTLQLQPFIPDQVCLVSESGIHSSGDIDLLTLVGVDAILVGEALVTAPDIPARVRAFSGL